MLQAQRTLALLSALLLAQAPGKWAAAPRGHVVTVVYQDGHTAQISNWTFHYHLSGPAPGLPDMISRKTLESTDLLVEFQQPAPAGITNRTIVHSELRRISYRWSQERWPLGNPMRLEEIALALGSGEHLRVTRLRCSWELLKVKEPAMSWCTAIELTGEFSPDTKCKLMRTAVSLEDPSAAESECLPVELQFDTPRN